MSNDDIEIVLSRDITMHHNLASLERDTGLSRNDYTPEQLLVRWGAKMKEQINSTFGVPDDILGNKRS